MTITTTNPTWYDLLDLDPSVSTGEIRAAWKSAIADLDPTDRRFRTLSEAAAVLLDEDRRAAYDADLAAQVEAFGEAEAVDADFDFDSEPEPEEPGAARQGRVRRPALPALPVWALAAVAILAVAALAAAVVTFLAGGGEEMVTSQNDNTTTSTLQSNYGQKISHDHATLVEKDAVGALAAAKAAAPAILSYDYRHLGADQSRAERYMTASNREDYDRVFATIKENAPTTKTVMTALPPLDAGVVRVSGDRVQVLLLLDTPTTNVKAAKPIPYQVYATFTMAREDGRWLVDKITTQPGQ